MSDVVGSAQVIIEPAGLAEFERELERGVSDALSKLEKQFDGIDDSIQKSAKSAKQLGSAIPGQLSLPGIGGELTEGLAGVTGEISETIAGVAGEASETLAGVAGETTETLAGVAGETAETFAGVGGEISETFAGVAGEISETFAGIGGELAEALAGVAGEAAETGTAVSGELAEAGVGAAALGGRLGGVGRALKFLGPLAVGAGLGVFFKSAADEASILQEATTKVQAVFGDLSPELEEFASTSASSLAIAESAALGAIGTFGNLFTSLGVTTEAAAQLSPDLVALSADLASFNDLAGGSDEALISLRAAVTGEFEPLRRLGVALTDVAVRNEAVDLGLADTAVTASVQSRILARYSLIMEQTANQQGDFARTSQFLANQQRSLTAEFTTLKANVGEALQPVLLNLIDIARGLLPSFEAMASAAADLGGNLINSLGPIFDALGPAFDALSGSIQIFSDTLAPVFANLGATIGPILARVVVGLGEILEAATPAIAALVDAADRILAAFGPSLDTIIVALVQLTESFVPLVTVLAPQFADWISIAARTLQGPFGEALLIVTSYLAAFIESGFLVPQVMDIIVTSVQQVASALGLLLGAAGEAASVLPGLGAVADGLKSAGEAASRFGDDNIDFTATWERMVAEAENVEYSIRDVNNAMDDGTVAAYEYNNSLAALLEAQRGTLGASKELAASLTEVVKASIEAADAQEIANRKAEEQKDAIDAQIVSIQNQKEALQASAEAQREAIDAQVKSIENQKKASQRAAKAQKKSITDQIDALRDQKKALQDAAKAEEEARKEQADAIKELNAARKEEVDQLQKLEDEARRAFSGFVNEADILANALADLPEQAEVSLSAFQETIKDNLSRTASFIAGIRILISRGANDLAAFLLQQGEGAEKALDEALALNDAQLEGQERFIEDYGGFNDEVLSELDRYIDQLDGVDVPEFDPIEVPEIEVDISDAVDKFDAQIEALQESADKIDLDLSGAVDNFDAQIDRLRESADKIDISANVDNFDAQIERLRAAAQDIDVTPTFADFQAATDLQLERTTRFVDAIQTLQEAGATETAQFFADQGLEALAAAEDAAAQDAAEIARREAVFGIQADQYQTQANRINLIGLQSALAGELAGRGITDNFIKSFDPTIIGNAYGALSEDAITETELLDALLREAFTGLSAQTGLSAKELSEAWGVELNLKEPTDEETKAVLDSIFGSEDETGEASGGLAGISAERFEKEFQWAEPTDTELGATRRLIESDRGIKSATGIVARDATSSFDSNMDLESVTRSELGGATDPFTAVAAGTTGLNSQADAAGEQIGIDFTRGITRSFATAQAAGGPLDRATRRLINTIEAIARSEAEADSPSRLFERFGDDIAAGAAMGIKDGINSRSGGLFDALTRELQGGTFSADLEANIGAGSLGAVELPALVGAGAAGAGGGGVGQSVRIEQNVTVQAPVGMSDTEAERIGTLIAQNARSNVVNSVRTSGRTTRSNT